MVVRLAAFSARNSTPPRPSSTNRPTRISMLRLDICWLSALGSARREHQRGQDEVHGQHRQRRHHHGAGGGIGHTLGRGLGLVTLVERDKGADHAEHRTLDDAVADVVVPDPESRTPINTVSTVTAVLKSRSVVELRTAPAGTV